MGKLVLSLENEGQSTRFAKTVARCCDELNAFEKGMIFYLKGDLGAGKSFFSRAFIQFFLPDQKVKSPTYTIVETYKNSTNSLHHLDLYRLCDPEELEYLAVRDLFSENFVALVEWPQKGFPVLPEADVELEFQYAVDQGTDERTVEITAISEKGSSLVNQIKHVIS